MPVRIAMSWQRWLAFLCCTPGLIGVAQTPSSTGQAIVTVSFNAVVLQTAEAQKSLGALQARFAPKEEHLKALNVEVETLRKQLAANSGSDDAERTARGRSLESKERQLQREADDFKADSQGESEQIYQHIAQKVYAFLQSYSQQHGYTLVIERGSDASPVVWYAAANTDITDEVIKAYNVQAGEDGAKPGKPLPDAPTHH
jgi:outer membrane protein